MGYFMQLRNLDSTPYSGGISTLMSILEKTFVATSTEPNASYIIFKLIGDVITNVQSECFSSVKSICDQLKTLANKTEDVEVKSNALTLSIIGQISFAPNNLQKIREMMNSLRITLMCAPLLKFKDTKDEYVINNVDSSLYSCLVDENSVSRSPDIFRNEIDNQIRELNEQPLIECTTTMRSVLDTITHNKIERIYKGVISADVKNNFSFDLIALYKKTNYKHLLTAQYNKLYFEVLRFWELDCLSQCVKYCESNQSELRAKKEPLKDMSKFPLMVCDIPQRYYKLRTLLQHNKEFDIRAMTENAEISKNQIELNGSMSTLMENEKFAAFGDMLKNSALSDPTQIIESVTNMFLNK